MARLRISPWLSLLFLTVALLLLQLAGVTPALAQETVTVKGVLVNGTGAAATPAGMPVVLHGFGVNDAPVSLANTTTDENGRFQFEQVTRNEGSYAVSVEYQGVLYSQVLEAADLSAEVALTVYETTQDVSVLQVERQLLVIAGVDQKDQQISALELVRLSNGSDRTLLPDLTNLNSGQISFLRFSLPPQSSDLDVQTNLPGGQVIPIGTGFALTAPVMPGDHNINYSYRFPYRGNSIAFTESLLQGANSYQVLIPQRLPDIEVSSLSPTMPMNVGGVEYRTWEEGGFSPGDKLQVQLRGLPEPGILTRLGNSLSNGAFWQISVPTALGATLALLLLYALFKAPRPAPAPLDAPAYPRRSADAIRRRDALVRAIAALDERFQQGQVSEEEYRARREQLKARILDER